MALVRNFKRKNLARNSVHEEIDAKYAVFETDGRTLLQIDTYGSADRKNPGKLSQTLQLDREGASALFQILKREFGFE